MKFTPLKLGHYYKPPTFRTIMAIKEMSEGEQTLTVLANCLVDEEGTQLYSGPDAVDEMLRPKEIVQLFEEIIALIEKEYDFSDPLSKQDSTTPTGNGFPYSVSGEPL